MRRTGVAILRFIRHGCIGSRFPLSFSARRAFQNDLFVMYNGMSSVEQKRNFGQPAPQTHPHILQEGHVTPGITADEYRKRRFRLMEMIGSQYQGEASGRVVVVIPSAAKSYMSADIPYPFRQNTDFLYLSGFLEPDSILVLEADCASRLPEHKSTLYVPRRDVHRELWDGPRSGTEGAVLLTGVDSAQNNDTFGEFLEDCINQHQFISLWYDTKKPAHALFHARNIDKLLSCTRRTAVESPRPLIQLLRLIKSAAEVELMKQTCNIASVSFKEVMKFTTEGVNEAHLYAKMDFECRIHGAEYLAYPPVVAGGYRANTIHYTANNQIVNAGELVLMDAGCECHGYTSDITRTWPVSASLGWGHAVLQARLALCKNVGTSPVTSLKTWDYFAFEGQFSRHQREIYEALLEIQEACLRLVCPGALTLNDIYSEMLMLLGRQLQRLRVVPKELSSTQLLQVAREFCPHHVSHYLGMDVHDTDDIKRSIQLCPGMVVTIEPGIYIPETRTSVPKELRGLGMRIEDDVLVTASGPYNLCSQCPKHPDEIESLMSRRTN